MFTAQGTLYYPNSDKYSFKYTFKTASQVVDFLNSLRLAARKSWYHTDIIIRDDITGVVIIGAI